MKKFKGQNHYKLTDGIKKRLFNGKFFRRPESLFVVKLRSENFIITELGFKLLTELGKFLSW